MSRIVLLLFVVSLGPAARAESQAPATPSAPGQPAAGAPMPSRSPAVLTDDQKTIYALGLLMHRSIRQFDLSPEEVELVKQALLDAAAGRPAVDVNEWAPKIDPMAYARGQRLLEREKAASVAYMDIVAGELGSIRMPSGLIYRDIVAGTGASPRPVDSVRVHYRGTLINGTVFDTSYDKSEPAVFRLNGVVPCWTEGVQRMKVGGKAQLVCPSSLAYGDVGTPNIPGGATLVFEVELLEIVGAAARPVN